MGKPELAGRYTRVGNPSAVQRSCSWASPGAGCSGGRRHLVTSTSAAWPAVTSTVFAAGSGWLVCSRPGKGETTLAGGNGVEGEGGVGVEVAAGAPLAGLVAALGVDGDLGGGSGLGSAAERISMLPPPFSMASAEDGRGGSAESRMGEARFAVLKPGSVFGEDCFASPLAPPAAGRP